MDKGKNEHTQSVILRVVAEPTSAPAEALKYLRSLMGEEEMALASAGEEDWLHIQERRGPRKEVNDYSRDY